MWFIIFLLFYHYCALWYQVEEEGDVDNKYRLRKLLQQCSIEEIRSVAIPKALEILSVGDFFLHKV